jgi:ElaB/YqjD/DUF883 family membrane-anchored ribosome-binding protein
MENEKNSASISGIRQQTHKNVDKIMDKAESIGVSSKENIEHLKQKATEVKENVDGYIQENPEKSVFIAAAIGAVAGGVVAATIVKKITDPTMN